MQLIFNDIGGGEVVLILVFILIFFGAKSIPSLARTFGRTIRQVREASSDIQNEIKKSGDEMKKDLNLQGMIEETAEDIRRPLDQYAQDIDNAVKYQPPKRPANKKPLGHEPRATNPPDIPETPKEESASTGQESTDAPKKEAEDSQPKGE
ncbi:MAG: hypothetical protein Crog4KO_14180 [Crocinitomicaceae bacterium]